VRRSILIAALLTTAAAVVPPASAQTPAYTIPPDNPFLATPGARPEIYVLGLRNPFRWSFDRQTGDMAIGDVGGSVREEIDFLAHGSIAGVNLGWNCREGTVAGPGPCSAPGATEPAYDYQNSGGDAVIGGYVIRDPDLSATWQGRYIFGDINDPSVKWLGPGASGPEQATGLSVSGLSSLGEDGLGHLYATSLGGEVLRLRQDSPTTLEATAIAGSFDSPMAIASPPGDPDRLFIAERGGTLKLRVNGSLYDFLSVETTTEGERGLLSVAVAPDYAGSGFVYVYYTDVNGDLQVDEFRRSANDPTKADPASRRPIITIPHPVENNHNGGTLQIGPDGYLYLSTGDGGSQGDPEGDAQSLASLLGKIIRINPRLGAPSPPKPPLPKDVTAPRLTTRVAKRQRVLKLKAVIAYARCNEACTLSLSARLQIAKRRYPLHAATIASAANTRVKLRARLTPRARRALRRALKRGKRPKVRVTLSAKDLAGNRSQLRRFTVRVHG
jgi:glucose/arabinose dehydrogenase